MRPLLGLLGATAVVAALPGAAPAAAAASQLVAVVIDFGPGGPAPIVRCVDISGQGQVSDIQVLAEAVPTFRLCSSGLLAGIDGYPSAGCGEPVPGSHYAYWAYFQGSPAGWSYASVGPASHAATPQSAIGFRFEPEGTGTSSDTVPSDSANPALDCPVSTPSSAPTTTAPTGTGAAGSQGSTAPDGTTTTTGASHAHGAPTTTTQRVAAHSAAAKESSALAVAPHGGSGSSATPTAVAVALFALLGGGAAVLVRRRRRAA